MTQLWKLIVRAHSRCRLNSLYGCWGQPLNRTSSLIQARFKSHQISYTHAAGTKPLMEGTVGNIVDMFSEKFADREAIVDRHQKVRKTYHQYKEDIDKFAMGLLALKFQKGDRIGIWCPNRYEWAIVLLAAAKIGLILVTLNPAYQAPELDYCIRKLQIKGIVMQETFKTQDYYNILAKLVPEMTNSKTGAPFKCKQHPYLNMVILLSEKALPFQDVMQSGGRDEKQILEYIQDKIDMCDPVMVQFTSGTTGNPKAPILSHHSLVNTTTLSVRAGYNLDYHRLCCPVPFFHVFGSSGGIICNLISGNATILPSPSFNSTEIINAIEEEKCDIIFGTPTMYIDIVQNPNFSKKDISTLKYILMAGAPCPPFLLKTLMEKLKTPYITAAYGCTETTGGLFANFKDDSIEDKLNTVGKVYDFVEAKLIDAEGNVVPTGTPGELCVRGYKIMLGYWGDDEKTKECFTKDGWYMTGDVGIMDERKYLKITDRTKHMIIRGGENIFPTEIENLLITHPKISEVQVVGVQDDRMGEEVSAWVILKNGETMTETELREFCKGKLAHFKIPRYIQFVDSLPKTLSGKVQKYILKEKMNEMLSVKAMQ